MKKYVCKCQDTGYCVENKDVDYSVCEKCFKNDMSPNYRKPTYESRPVDEDRRRYEEHCHENGEYLEGGGFGVNGKEFLDYEYLD